MQKNYIASNKKTDRLMSVFLFIKLQLNYLPLTMVWYF